MKTNHRAISYLVLFVAYLIWGIAGPVIKYTLTYFPPSVFLTYRFGLSMIISVIMLLVMPKHLPKKIKIMPQILLYGFLVSTAAIGLVFLGFNKTTAITGSIFGAMTPIATTVAGALFLREHVTKRERLGISIAMLGTLSIVLEPLLFGRSEGVPISFSGNMFHVAALAVTVLTAIMAKLILRDTIDPLTLTHISFTVGFATMLPITLANYSVTDITTYIWTAPLAGHLGVIYMAVLSGNLAYTFWHMGEKSIEIGEASLFTYFYPLFAVPFSIFWLHETITPVFVASSIIITVGVIIAEYRTSLSAVPVVSRRKHRRKR